MIEVGLKSRLAVFDVDAQNCFTPRCPKELPVPDGHSIVSELNAQAELAAYRLGSKDAHPSNAVWVASHENPQFSPVLGHKHVDVHWDCHAVPGSEGFELIAGLPAVTEYDYFVWKGVEPDMHPYGACFHDLDDQLSTGVIEFLRDKKVDTLIVGGLALDYCVKTTVLQLLRAGFRVIVNLAATKSLTKETGVLALREMTAAGVEIVESSSQIKMTNAKFKYVRES